MTRRICLLLLCCCFLSACQNEDTEIEKIEPDSIKKEALVVKGMAKPIGPYSPAIKSGDFLFLSGQIGKNPETGLLVDGGVAEEVDQIMKNIATLLNADGLDFSSVVQSQVYLKNIEDYTAMNDVYAGYFTGLVPPARAAVEVANLPGGALVEIMMTARH